MNMILLKKTFSLEQLENSLKSFEQQDKTNNHYNYRRAKLAELEEEILFLKQQGDYEDCIPIYKKLIYIEPNYKDYYLQMADVHILIGDLSTALTYQNKARQLDISDPDAACRLEAMQISKGFILLKNNLMEETQIKCLESCISGDSYTYLK